MDSIATSGAMINELWVFQTLDWKTQNKQDVGLSSREFDDRFPQESGSRLVLDLKWMYTTVIGAASLSAALVAGAAITARVAMESLVAFELWQALFFIFANVPILVAEAAIVASIFQVPVSTPGFADVSI